MYLAALVPLLPVTFPMSAAHGDRNRKWDRLGFWVLGLGLSLIKREPLLPQTCLSSGGKRLVLSGRFSVSTFR